jgi:hypothetical protein
MSLQYCNKSKSQLTSPTPAQLPAVALSPGHIVYGVSNDIKKIVAKGCVIIVIVMMLRRKYITKALKPGPF